MYLKKTITFLVILLLISLLCPPRPAFATDIIEDTASTWEELWAWLDNHRTRGGTLRLTADIEADKVHVGYIRPEGAEPVLLDLDGHRVVITGALELMAWNFSMQSSSEGGNIRIADGAELAYETYGTGTLAGAGPLLWQEEGAVLLTEGVEESLVHYAAGPVAAYVLSPDMQFVDPGEDARAYLPSTVWADTCFRGKKESRVSLPVRWNLDTDTADNLKNRMRCDITGALDIPALDIPVCTVVFPDQPLTWAGVTVKDYKGIYMISAEYLFTGLSGQIEAQYSFDAEQYKTVQTMQVQDPEWESVNLKFMDTDIWDLKETDLGWEKNQYPSLYLRLFWADAPEEAMRYSDVLKIDGSTLEITGDTGGNRGGGTALLPPAEGLPGDTGGKTENTEKQDGTPAAADNKGSKEEKSDISGSGTCDYRKPDGAGDEAIQPETDEGNPAGHHGIADTSAAGKVEEYKAKSSLSQEKKAEAAGHIPTAVILAGAGSIVSVMTLSAIWLHPRKFKKKIKRTRKRR